MNEVDEVLCLTFALDCFARVLRRKKHIVSGDFYLNSQYYIEDESICSSSAEEKKLD